MSQMPVLFVLESKLIDFKIQGGSMRSPSSNSVHKLAPMFLLLVCCMLGCQNGDSSSSNENSSGKPSQKPQTEQATPKTTVVNNNPLEQVKEKKSPVTVTGSIKVLGWEHEFSPSTEYSEGENYYFLDETDFGISVSYWGVETAHSQWIHAGSTFPAMGMRWTPVVNKTFEPRNAALRFDPENGWSFQHDNLPPGTYCFIVGWKQNYYQCVWKEVESGKDLQIDFEIDLNQVGVAEIVAPENSKVWFQFQSPARIEGNQDTIENYQPFEKNGWSVVEWRGNSSITIDESGKSILSGMAPGHYRFFCSKYTQPVDVVITPDTATTIKFEN